MDMSDEKRGRLDEELQDEVWEEALSESGTEAADEPEEEDELSEETSGEEEETEEADVKDEPGQPKADARETRKQENTFRMRRLLRNALRDEDEGGSLKDMFNDIQISGEWLKRHWSFLVIVTVCMLLFVTNRYQAQQEIIEESRLRQELNDWKYVWLTQFSELTRSSRQSYIEESLRHKGDSTLKPSKDAPFIIKAK